VPADVLERGAPIDGIFDRLVVLWRDAFTRVDGARLLMQRDQDLGMAATVAYEHHIMLNGGGYPVLHYKRECALASRLVHICDVYDALSTKRPYRDAWPTERTMAYLEERAGEEFDPDLVATFIRTLKQGQAQVRVLSDETQQT